MPGKTGSRKHGRAARKPKTARYKNALKRIRQSNGLAVDGGSAGYVNPYTREWHPWPPVPARECIHCGGVVFLNYIAYGKHEDQFICGSCLDAIL